MIYFNKHTRSTQDEIMDSFDLQGKEMQDLLTDLKKVNVLLGGKSITFRGIKQLLKHHESTNITLLDVGCGDGELLRQCCKYFERKGLQVKGIGIDANAHIIEEAKKRSESSAAIEFKVVDVFEDSQNIPSCDIAICTLFLHHFENERIVTLLKILSEKASCGIVVNDLHRSKWAFQLFKIFSYLFIKTKIARHDGLVSVARGFKKQELKNLFKLVENTTSNVQWMWAFRYLGVVLIHKKKNI